MRLMMEERELDMKRREDQLEKLWQKKSDLQRKRRGKHWAGGSRKNVTEMNNKGRRKQR